jgi:hypothetical protein
VAGTALTAINPAAKVHLGTGSERVSSAATVPPSRASPARVHDRHAAKHEEPVFVYSPLQGEWAIGIFSEGRWFRTGYGPRSCSGQPIGCHFPGLCGTSEGSSGPFLIVGSSGDPQSCNPSNDPQYHTPGRPKISSHEAGTAQHTAGKGPGDAASGESR